MISIKSKYNEHKETTSIEYKSNKPCTPEAISIIAYLCEIIIDRAGVPKESIIELIKENLERGNE